MSDYIKYTKRVEAFNDDIPYEVRMKFILEAYIRDKKSLEDLKNYAKGLEEENCMLTKKLRTWILCMLRVGTMRQPSKNSRWKSNS